MSFFNILKGGQIFQWTKECEYAFQAMKQHLSKPSIIWKPIEGKKLMIYLIVSPYPISVVLFWEEDKVQHHMCNKRLLELETIYIDMEKLAYALIIAWWKLTQYFHAHSTVVVTN